MSACPKHRPAASLAGLVLAGWLGAACGGGVPAAEAGGSAAHPLVGRAAPAFELPAQFGAERVSLAEHRGQVTIVDFWATWCKPCKASFPAYQRLAERFGGKLAVIGISIDEEPDGIPAFAEETGVSFPLAWDEGEALAEAYAPPNMPTSYVVDEQGIVRFVHPGYRPGDEARIERDVASLLE